MTTHTVSPVTCPYSPTTEAVLVVLDGTARSATIVTQVLHSGRVAAVIGSDRTQLAAYRRLAAHQPIWVADADPADPAAIDRVIESATTSIGPVIIILDPSGLLADVDAADRAVA